MLVSALSFAGCATTGVTRSSSALDKRYVFVVMRGVRRDLCACTKMCAELHACANRWTNARSRHFFGVRIRIGTILGRFSIIYSRGLGLRIRVKVWVRVRARFRVWVRVGVGVRVSVVLWSW